jgi:hypothetical protein
MDNPMTCNRASADFIFSSYLIHEEYQRILPDYEVYRSRALQPGPQEEAVIASELLGEDF